MANTALITGASSGIGAEFARIHAATGGDLVLVARREEALNALKDELQSQHNIAVTVIPADLNDETAPQQIFSTVQQLGIDIDILINNAGFGGRGLFHERDWDQDRSMIQVNIVALSALTRLFVPVFVAKNAGRILNVSSTASLMPGPLQAVYYATKAFVTSFSNALAEELSGTNITVTALLPGATDTGFSAASDLQGTDLFAGAVPPHGVAQAGYNAMMAGKMDVIAGLPLGQRIMVKLMPLLPKKMILKQIRAMQEVD